ncbi:hypothetical protein DMUE_5748 [Dictyocoela muelleri]|nr:hypothetical protein DMUE_5748 [Dictyocoela muelleri]
MVHKLLTSTNNAFFSVAGALDYLVENEIIKPTSTCILCGAITKLVIYREYCSERILYRCSKNGCQRKYSITSFKCKLNVLINIIYFLMKNSSYDQIIMYLNVSKKTIYAVKSKLRNCYSLYISKRPVLLGGIGVIVEVDESVLCRKGTIRSPTSTDDKTPGTTWILGGIDNTQERNFFVKRIKNREKDTLENAMEGLIGVGSKLHTDGHPSYPIVAKNLGLNHKVVIHSEGFKAPDGTHTNNIEGFWAVLKSSMRKEHGVKRCNIDEWLEEYTFKKRYLNNLDSFEFQEIYNEILKLFFN